MFVVSTTSLAFVFTWLFNNTQASLLLSLLLHGSVDGTLTYMQVLADEGLFLETPPKTAATWAC